MFDAGVIEPWCGTFAEITKAHSTSFRRWDNTQPHYVGVPGMNAIGKFLAKDLEVRLQTQVKDIIKADKQWALYDANNQLLGSFDWVLMTAPVAQAKALLPNTVTLQTKLEHIHMQACYSLMLGFEAPLELGFQAALIKGADISWISVNSSKPGRSEYPTLLVHSTNRWADQHIETDIDQVQAHLIRETQEVLGNLSNIAVTKRHIAGAILILGHKKRKNVH